MDVPFQIKKSSTSSSPRRLPRSASDRPGLKVCVSFGSGRVQTKEVSVRLKNGKTVTKIKADVCSACGERYFDLEAMQKLEAEEC